MDLICVNCAEPWDNDCLHDEAEARGTTYKVVAAEFRARGCEALATAYGATSCQRSDSFKAQAAGAMYDLLGDDMDGAAAMLEDLDAGYF